ncbi:hypothetical protein IQ230_10735 [Gloeocapsopsis crepidinum LEGE 06123]|uniref:Uncharacterized protein n=1 Tax=Gloeocapsopsis crepidinum LEGE 06123 TaxID=588587 RepID=A0ABR9URX9_9CHRO|nr:hypothetical protein [Gloeocapsopsis crepidinum]MBE9190820.1 hypothetical protein [Gloeocapsopsis crepidinum LEGE 06123]
MFNTDRTDSNKQNEKIRRSPRKPNLLFVHNAVTAYDLSIIALCLHHLVPLESYIGVTADS